MTAAGSRKEHRFQYNGKYYRALPWNGFNKGNWRITYTNGGYETYGMAYAVNEGPVYDVAVIFLNNQEQYAGLTLEEFIHKVSP